MGIPGVKTSLPLILTQAKLEKCNLAQVANRMSTAPAKAYGISNQRVISIGYNADLVLVDGDTYKPVLRKEIQSKYGWSLFEGWNLTG